MDVWNSAGRGYAIDPGLGQTIFNDIFNNGQPPWIWWVIWQGQMWSAGGGWEGAPWGPQIQTLVTSHTSTSLSSKERSMLRFAPADMAGEKLEQASPQVSSTIRGQGNLAPIVLECYAACIGAEQKRREELLD
jgi:hypothetical protein